MPTVKPYKYRRGLYVQAVHRGLITTYQVTPEGQLELEKRGLKNGGELTADDLQTLLQRGLIYTGGGGPGEIEPLTGSARKRNAATAPPNAAGCGTVIAVSVGLTLLVVIVRYLYLFAMWLATWGQTTWLLITIAFLVPANLYCAYVLLFRSGV